MDAVYPMVWMDAMHYKVKEEGRVVPKAIYTILGVNQKGLKEALGIYVSEAEGANFWLQVLTDLSNRGVKDILIASIDNLKGFPEAITTIFPTTDVQLCVVHQIRNSLRYVASKDQKAFLRDLKEVYRASTKALAEQKLALSTPGALMTASRILSACLPYHLDLFDLLCQSACLSDAKP